MNLYLHCLLHLTMSFLLSSEDIRHFLLSRWRQLMAMLLAIPIFMPNHLIMGRDWPITWSHEVQSLVTLFVFHLIFCFCKGLKMMGRQWQDPHSLMYICTCSVHMSSLPFTGYLKNFQKILFLCNSSHNFTPKRNELRYHCCFSQLYFIGH
jgi:hypothetical protein